MNMITPSAVIPVILIEAEAQPSNPVGLVVGLFAGFLDFAWNDRSRNVMTRATTERSI
jgi:hypothetical protein